MAKTCLKLTMQERFHLLNILPGEEGPAMLLVRRLKEALAASEQDNIDYHFRWEYRCPHMDFDEKGRRFQCEWSLEADEPPQCPIHKLTCAQSQRLVWDPRMADKVKTIELGEASLRLLQMPLKELYRQKKLRDEDGTAPLYEKIVGPFPDVTDD